MAVELTNDGPVTVLVDSTVEVRHNEQVYRGRGVSTDIIEAAARAYLSVLNRVATQPTRQVPASSPVAAGTQ
jgi:hypothetical protein